MDIERAKEITAACVRNRVAIAMGNDYVPLPACSLEEMCAANRIVSELPSEETTNADGSKSYFLRMKSDPRGIAASYAWEQYNRNPQDYLGAMGLRLKDPDDDDDEPEENPAETILAAVESALDRAAHPADPGGKFYSAAERIDRILRAAGKVAA